MRGRELEKRECSVTAAAARRRGTAGSAGMWREGWELGFLKGAAAGGVIYDSLEGAGPLARLGWAGPLVVGYMGRQWANR